MTDERRITRPSPAAAVEASGMADEYRVLAGEIGKTIAPTLAEVIDRSADEWYEAADLAKATFGQHIAAAVKCADA